MALALTRTVLARIDEEELDYEAAVVLSGMRNTAHSLANRGETKTLRAGGHIPIQKHRGQSSESKGPWHPKRTTRHTVGEGRVV